MHRIAGLKIQLFYVLGPNGYEPLRVANALPTVKSAASVRRVATTLPIRLDER